MEQDDPVVMLSVDLLVLGMFRSCRDVLPEQHLSTYPVHGLGDASWKGAFQDFGLSPRFPAKMSPGEDQKLYLKCQDV